MCSIRPLVARRKVAGLSCLAVAGFTWVAVEARATTCASVQLCLAIDGSGSIAVAEFDLVRNGLASAIADATIVPQSGSVEISVVQFGSSVSTVVSPTVVASQAAADAIAGSLRGMPKDDGSTNMAGAVTSCTSLLGGSCSGSRQVINVVTDGEPNSQSDIVAARNAAISAGIDEINAEAVDAPTSAFDFLLNQLVHPQPGSVAPPFTGPGFVIGTDSFDDFEEAVRGKIGQIVKPTDGVCRPEIQRSREATGRVRRLRADRTLCGQGDSGREDGGGADWGRGSHRAKWARQHELRRDAAERPTVKEG